MNKIYLKIYLKLFVELKLMLEIIHFEYLDYLFLIDRSIIILLFILQNLNQMNMKFQILKIIKYDFHLMKFVKFEYLNLLKLEINNFEYYFDPIVHSI